MEGRPGIQRILVVVLAAWLFTVVAVYYLVHKPFTVQNALALGRAVAGFGRASVTIALETGIGLLALHPLGLGPIEGPNRAEHLVSAWNQLSSRRALGPQAAHTNPVRTPRWSHRLGMERLRSGTLPASPDRAGPLSRGEFDPFAAGDKRVLDEPEPLHIPLGNTLDPANELCGWE